MASRLELVIRLRDGRELGYAEYGRPDGSPLFYFHGTPGSRLELGLPGVTRAMEERGLRVVAVDRPGMGLSSFKPRRRIRDWPTDIVELAERLSIDRFRVLGASGGSPYALACASQLADRVVAVGVVSGIAPSDVAEVWDALPEGRRKLLRLGRRFSPLLKPVVRRLGEALTEGSEHTLQQMLDGLSAVDRAQLAEPSVREALVASWRAAFQQGPAGPWWDLVLAARRWRFVLAEIRMPVLFWFGGVDQTVPPTEVRYLANAVRRSEARFYPAEGHLSIMARRYREVLDGLMAGTVRPPDAQVVNA